MDVNRGTVKGFGEVGCTARNWKATGGQEDAVKRATAQQPFDALHLKRLIPRRPRIDENVAGLARNQNDVAVVVNAGKSGHLHA